MLSRTVIFNAFILLFMAFALLNACGGGGDSGSDSEVPAPVNNSDSITTERIDSTGGIIIHPKGLMVDFPEGCLSEVADISIQEVPLPSPLPDGIKAVSTAFKISPDGLKLDSPAKVTVQPSAVNHAAGDDTLAGMYRWDGVEWEPIGHYFEDDNISATTVTFSTFVRVEIIYPEQWKKFVFLNKGNDPANLIVSTSRPYAGPQIGGSVHVPDASADYPERVIWLPLGCYEFCYEWYIYNPFEFKREMVHNFEGDAVWQHCLDDQTGLATGESVWIDTTYGDYDGPCGPRPVDGSQGWQWQASGRGDHQGCDVTNTMGSAIPDPTLAEEGLIAVCWDGVTVCNPTFDCARYGAWCTYKDLSLDDCPAKESSAYMYTAVPGPSEF